MSPPRPDFFPAYFYCLNYYRPQYLFYISSNIGDQLPDLPLVSSVKCFECGEPVLYQDMDEHMIISHGYTRCPDCSQIFNASRDDEHDLRYHRGLEKVILEQCSIAPNAVKNCLSWIWENIFFRSMITLNATFAGYYVLRRRWGSKWQDPTGCQVNTDLSGKVFNIPSPL